MQIGNAGSNNARQSNGTGKSRNDFAALPEVCQKSAISVRDRFLLNERVGDGICEAWTPTS